MGFETLGIDKNVVEPTKDLAQETFNKLTEQCGNLYEHSVDFIQEYLKELKEHDRSTYEHSVEVGNITSFIVRALEDALPEDEREILLRASFLHDCGKIGIESEILNKEGKLSHDEMEKIRMHPEIGYDILKEWNIYVAYVVKFHHKHQRNAYPQIDRSAEGIVDEEKIHKLSRMLAMIDSFQAMLANRPGENNKSKAIDEAISELRKNFILSGDQEVIILLEEYYRKKHRNEKVDYNQYIGLAGNA